MRESCLNLNLAYTSALSLLVFAANMLYSLLINIFGLVLLLHSLLGNQAPHPQPSSGQPVGGQAPPSPSAAVPPAQTHPAPASPAAAGAAAAGATSGGVEAAAYRMSTFQGEDLDEERALQMAMEESKKTACVPCGDIVGCMECLDAPGRTAQRQGGGQCVVCWDAPAAAACVPCGHIVGCVECLGEVKKKGGCCPVCRAKIQLVMKVFQVS